MLLLGIYLVIGWNGAADARTTNYAPRFHARDYSCSIGHLRRITIFDRCLSHVNILAARCCSEALYAGECRFDHVVTRLASPTCA